MGGDFSDWHYQGNMFFDYNTAEMVVIGGTNNQYSVERFNFDTETWTPDEELRQRCFIQLFEMLNYLYYIKWHDKKAKRSLFKTPIGRIQNKSTVPKKKLTICQK